MTEKLDEVEATQATKGMGVKWVLVIGTVAAVIALFGIYAIWM